MRKLEAKDLKSMGLFKHYRVVRRWAAKTNKITDADLELLIYLDCIDLFKRQDFVDGLHTYSWDKRRWEKLLKGEWIKVWRSRNRTTQKYNIYTVSFKGKQLISRIYRILLGTEDLPTSLKRNSIMKGDTYSDRAMIKAINKVNKDKNR